MTVRKHVQSAKYYEKETKKTCLDLVTMIQKTIHALTLLKNAKGLLMELVEKNTRLKINKSFVSILLENALMFDLENVVNNIDLMTTNYKTIFVSFKHLNALMFKMVLAQKGTKKKVLNKISANLVVLIALMSITEPAGKSIDKYLITMTMFAYIKHHNAN